MNQLSPKSPSMVVSDHNESEPMGFFSATNRQKLQPEHPTKQATRFKRIHTRGSTELMRDGTMDPTPSLSRSEAVHQRPKAKPAVKTIYRPQSLGAALHATDPIPLSVLQQALPLRAAEIAAKDQQ